ncbi:MAG: hypothetical protein QM495_11860 [Lutibacter sp.]|uniref:hypothetical protein n=1 Tax=Lutibacter sp. TaxID=1925666 RepID=UPI00385D0CB1
MGAKELIGKIIKQENIDTIDVNKIPKTFVINVPDPYKSYYSRFTDIDKPVAVIFVTKSINSFEKILRVTKKINDTYNLELEGAKCEVTIKSRKLNGVRVRGMNRFTDVAQVQQYYHDEGFGFVKSEKFSDTEAVIRINRFFEIEELDKGIYKSIIEDGVFYVELPKFISWEEFKRITIEVKNNMTDRSFDIAKGILYVNGGITEIVRVVKPKATIDLLKTIQQKYIDRL